MAEVQRARSGIEVPVSANLDQLRRGLEEVRRIAQSPNLIKLTPQMSFDDRAVAKEMNRIIGKMEREAAQQTARVRLFGETRPAAMTPGTREYHADTELFRQFTRTERLKESAGRMVGVQMRHLSEGIEQAAVEATEIAAKQAQQRRPGRSFSTLSGGLLPAFGAAFAGAQAMEGVGALADMGRAFGMRRGDESALARLRAAESIPLVGSLVGASDRIFGQSRFLEAQIGARASDESAQAAYHAARTGLFAGRLSRRGEEGEAARVSGYPQLFAAGMQRRDLQREFEQVGLSRELQSDGMVGFKVNAAGARLKAAISRIDSAIEATEQAIEEQAQELERISAGQAQVASQQGAAFRARTRAGGAFSPTQRAAAEAEAAALEQAARSSARFTAAGMDPRKLSQAAIDSAADRARTEQEARQGAMEAAGEQAIAVRSARERQQAHRARVAQESNAVRVTVRRSEASGLAAELRAQGRHQEADRLELSSELDAQTANLPTPLMTTRAAFGQGGAAERALATRQQRERDNTAAALRTRGAMASASGRGMGDLAGIIGLVAAQESEFRNIRDDTDPAQLRSAQLDELRGLRQSLMRPTSYGRFGDALSEAAGGPGGDQGQQMVQILQSIDRRIADLGGGFPLP